jgi:hypothetical protein
MKAMREAGGMFDTAAIGNNQRAWPRLSGALSRRSFYVRSD